MLAGRPAGQPAGRCSVPAPLVRLAYRLLRRRGQRLDGGRCSQEALGNVTVASANWWSWGVCIERDMFTELPVIGRHRLGEQEVERPDLVG